MEMLIQTLTNLLILSAIYILVALGFAFVFNLLGVFNLAHGSIYMVAGYICYFLIVGIGLNSWLSMLSSVIIVGALGIVLEKYCFRPFLGNFNRTVMICVAISVILTTSINIWIGTRIIAIPTFASGVIGAAPYSVNIDRVVTFVIGAVILIAVIIFVNYTRWGQQMQAMTQNLEGAALQGIGIHRTSAIACSLGCALAALSGVLSGTMYNLSPFNGDLTLIKVLMLVIVAGVGSFKGIFIMGLIMGTLYAGLPLMLPGAMSDVVAVLIVIFILLIRPQGFFGHEA